MDGWQSEDKVKGWEGYKRKRNGIMMVWWRCGREEGE